MGCTVKRRENAQGRSERCGIGILSSRGRCWWSGNRIMALEQECIKSRRAAPSWQRKARRSSEHSYFIQESADGIVTGGSALIEIVAEIDQRPRVLAAAPRLRG